MRTLHHFNTVNGNNDTINERKVEDGDKDEKLKGDDRSVFYHIIEKLREIRDWSNSAVGEPIVAAVTLVFVLIISFPLLRQMYKVYSQHLKSVFN